MAKRWGRKQGAVSRYSVKNVLSHSTDKLRRGTFLFYTKFLVLKYFMDTRCGVKEGGVSRYSFESFFSQRTEKLRREHFCVSLNSGVQRNMPLRGFSQISRENLLSHSTEKLRRGTFLRFTNFRCSKKFAYEGIFTKF